MGNSVMTTAREEFTGSDSADLAWLLYRRFGRDFVAAHVAWCRLLQNNCTVRQFSDLAVASRLNDGVA
jgi:hypothetical protein